MPLSKPVERDLIHTRAIQCSGYKRKDGLWDIDGYLTDTKAYTFDNIDRGDIPAGEPIHHMLMRITVDDDLVIHNAEASSEFTPYSLCGEVTGAFKKLKGVKIGPGWRRNIKEIMGGTEGCTHLRDLLTGPMAVTAYQTIIPIKSRQNEGKPRTRRPALIETCHAYAADGPIVKRQWPDYHEAKE